MTEREELRHFIMENIPPVFEDLGWEHTDAQKYAKTLIDHYGEPDDSGSNFVGWYNKDGFTKISVKDEAIPHNFPMPHKDFVYSAIKLSGSDVKKMGDLLSDFADITGSIIFDGLKKEVSARCGKVIKNAVTIGFVQDALKDPSIITKAEYSKRIKNDIIPEWYKDSLGEKEMNESLPKWKLRKSFGTRPPPPGGPKGTSDGGSNTNSGIGDKTNSYGHHMSPRGNYTGSRGGT